VQIKTVRTKEELAPVLLSPEEKGPDFAYWVFSGITQGNQWENMTILSPGTYGQEFVKTFGHYHNDPHEETYRVVNGKGILLLQKKHFEDGSWVPNKVDRFIIVSILPGDKTVITQEWGHSLSNIGNDPLITLDNWTHGHTPADYEEIEDLHGMAFYLVKNDGTADIEPNPNYIDHPTPEFMTASEFAKLTKLSI